MRHRRWAAVAMVLACVAAGDVPTLKFATSGGVKGDLAGLRGKIVVVHFWHSGERDSLAGAPTIKKVMIEYREKGVAVVGVSLDDEPGAFAGAVKAWGMDWPQAFEAGAKRTGQAGGRVVWGIARGDVPVVVMLDPTGREVWRQTRGAATEKLVTAVELQLAQTPPKVFDDTAIETAREVMAEVEALLGAGRVRLAMRRAVALPESAREEPGVAAAAAKMSVALDAAARGELAGVDADMSAGRWAMAAVRLEEIRDALRGTAVGDKAVDELGSITENPDLKRPADAGRREVSGEAAIEDALWNAERGRRAAAYLALAAARETYAGTEAGKRAALAAADYEKDEAFVRGVRDAAAGDAPRALLSAGETFEKAGMTEKAQAKYREIVTRYPGTTAAQAAAEKLAK